MSEVPNILKILSLARTALDDPGALALAEEDDEYRELWNLAKADARLSERGDVRDWRDPHSAFAIHLIDQAMHLLNGEEPATVLTTCGRLIADIADGFTELERDTDTVMLGDDLHKALDLIDVVVDALAPESPRSCIYRAIE